MRGATINGASANGPVAKASRRHVVVCVDTTPDERPNPNLAAVGSEAWSSLQRLGLIPNKWSPVERSLCASMNSQAETVEAMHCVGRSHEGQTREGLRTDASHPLFLYRGLFTKRAELVGRPHELVRVNSGISLASCAGVLSHKPKRARTESVLSGIQPGDPALGTVAQQ